VSDFILNDGLESIKGSEPVDILWGAVKQVLEEEHVKE
jgi:predicted DsbA family dithiol-disulfide isomerase